MKKPVHFFFYLLTAGLLMTQGSIAQTGDLAPDQNPDYRISRDKYMKLADSINAWHSTTPQETYKAIDYLEDKREAREQRRAFRRELKLERARRGGYYYYDDYYYNDYNYRRPYYRRYYYDNYPYYYNSYNYPRNRNAYSNYAFPLALTLGWLWCR